MTVFDENGDGAIDDAELVIDNDEKEAAVVEQLQDLGLENPRIQAETRPYSINHNVTHGEWATKDCDTCHSEDSTASSSDDPF